MSIIYKGCVTLKKVGERGVSISREVRLEFDSEIKELGKHEVAKSRVHSTKQQLDGLILIRYKRQDQKLTEALNHQEFEIIMQTLLNQANEGQLYLEYSL